MKTIEQDIRKIPQEIIDGMKCPKDFICYTSGFRNICRAMDIGLASFVACLAANPMECRFAIDFGGLFFCQCSLRIYICKELKR